MCIYHPGFFFKTCSKNTWKKGPKIILSVCTNPKISPVLSTKEMIEQNFLSIQFNRPSHVLHTHLLCKYSHCLCINEIINEWNVEYFQETLPSLGCLAHLTFFIIFFVLLFFSYMGRWQNILPALDFLLEYTCCNCCLSYFFFI